MARGRFLSKTISTNRRLGLAGPDPALAWFLSLPHADQQGCLPGSIADLAMTCFPVATNFYGWTQESISGVVNLLSLHGLWRLVIDDNGESVIYIERFEEHQILRGDRETPSKYMFSNGVASYSGVPLEEWWSNSKNPPRNSRGTPTKLPRNAHEVQVQVQDQVEGEGEVGARVRATPTTSPESSRKSESHYETPRVISAWKSVSPDYALTSFDRAAIQRHAHHLPKDLEGFFREKIGLGKWKLEWALDELNKPQVGGNGEAEPTEAQKKLKEETLAYLKKMGCKA